jgi:hypothetical protein
VYVWILFLCSWVRARYRRLLHIYIIYRVGVLDGCYILVQRLKVGIGELSEEWFGRSSCYWLFFA